MNQPDFETAERQIEISIEQAKSVVARKDAVMRLRQNPDYQLIFDEGYFIQEPARLVSLLTDSEWAGDERQEEIMRDMYGVSATRQYLVGIVGFGNQMERQIASSESQLEELRDESTEYTEFQQEG